MEPTEGIYPNPQELLDIDTGSGDLAPGMTKIEADETPLEQKDNPSPHNAVNEDREKEDLSVDALFEERNVEALVSLQDNPDAHIAAMLLMANPTQQSQLNMLREDHKELLSQLNMRIIAEKLGIEAESVEASLTSIEVLQELTVKYQEAYERANVLGNIIGSGQYSGDRKLEREAESALLHKQARESFRKLRQLEEELFRPYRIAVVDNAATPEKFKVEAIQGSDHQVVSDQEKDMLRRAFSRETSQVIREQIAKVVLKRVGEDIDMFSIAPVNELLTYGLDKDQYFLAAMGSWNTTREIVERTLAPAFFPDRDPEIIAESWDALRNITHTGGTSQRVFYTQVGIHDATIYFDMQQFEIFMDHADKLIPIVKALEPFGFTYTPKHANDSVALPDYVTSLIRLGEDLDQLKQELSQIRDILPNYSFDMKIHSERRDSGNWEYIVQDNPFVIAIQQVLTSIEWEKIDSNNNVIKSFTQLEVIVSDRWRGGFLAAFLASMCRGRGDHLTAEVMQRRMDIVNQFAMDPSLEDSHIRQFGAGYVLSSLDHRSQNTAAAFAFCDAHIDRLEPSRFGRGVQSQDDIWAYFASEAADVYRYPIYVGESEAGQALKAKDDLIFARGAISRIRDPKVRDKAIVDIIYALVDEDIGDLDDAETFRDLIEDVALCEEVNEEITLEKERRDRTETVAWKRMEKARRVARENETFIRRFFGFDSPEGMVAARSEMSKKYGRYYKDEAFDPEKPQKLEDEIARIKDDFTVTLNITWRNVLKVLDAGRILSIWENRAEMELRNRYGRYHYGERRDQVERYMGNRAKGGRKDPHPVYGAAYSPNGRDEFSGGTGGGYGECYVTLKEDNIKDRTTFVYDDSFDGYVHWLLDWQGGMQAKAIHNLRGSESEHGYVEAQVLGGVSLEDIESINIPLEAIQAENKYGYFAGQTFFQDLERVRQEYPDITFNIIDSNGEIVT